MLMEAFEILNSAGQDTDTFVTDFAVYKLLYILTIYIPLLISTFLLSQEYLGAKIACFAPENFTDSQAGAVDEFCWNNGYWLSEGTPMIKSLYTQPHRYYPLYLPIQAVISMSPIVLWNVMTKAKLLAILRGTEDFLEELLEMVTKDDADDDTSRRHRVLERMRQFHQTCVNACHNADLARVGVIRICWELFLCVALFCLQFVIYNRQHKVYYCGIPSMYGEGIECTVPILDLLDAVWSINVSSLLMAVTVNIYMVVRLWDILYSEYQPLFYNSLPFGDSDDFNEKITWDSSWTKASYLLLTRLFLENNSIMTKAYVLQALKSVAEEEEEEEEGDVIRDAVEELKGTVVEEKQSTEEVTLRDAAESDYDDGQAVPEVNNVRKRRSRDRSPVVTPSGQDYTILTAVVVLGFFLLQMM